jgi:hypothetical protein
MRGPSLQLHAELPSPLISGSLWDRGEGFEPWLRRHRADPAPAAALRRCAPARMDQDEANGGQDQLGSARGHECGHSARADLEAEIGRQVSLHGAHCGSFAQYSSFTRSELTCGRTCMVERLGGKARRSHSEQNRRDSQCEEARHSWTCLFSLPCLHQTSSAKLPCSPLRLPHPARPLCVAL